MILGIGQLILPAYQYQRFTLLPHGHDVVDLEDHAHALGGEGDGRGVDQEGLQDVGLEHVRDAVLLHVDARIGRALRVGLAELRHDVDRVQPRVLGQRIRHHLKRLGERADAVVGGEGERERG